MGETFKAKVKWNGNHYFSGESVSGSKHRVKDGKHEIYDDEENYVAGLGDFTRNTWVEIDESTLESTTKQNNIIGKE